VNDVEVYNAKVEGVKKQMAALFHAWNQEGRKEDDITGSEPSR